MSILLSGYEKTTKRLMFRVYSNFLDGQEETKNYKCSHLAAMDLLGAALAEDYRVRHVKIHRTGLGKPQLLHDSLHMNLSHCKGMAAAAVGCVPLGIDVESPRAVKEKLIQRVCSEEEQTYISASENKNLAFSRLWTLKEAYAKYTGEGIGIPFSTLDFSIVDNRVIFRHHSGNEVIFCHFVTENQISVSVCVPKGDYIIEYS
ncbi:MAG: 4'-phosphopantetheinyl transferase superfamily protein [Oscillospiraceae bacterium]|nr:4'-phosphopantetheinyl transferase superfamily protein [Oscillospiraceae bacterium]